MLKKVIILAMFGLVLLVLLSLWAFDMIQLFGGKGKSFHFFTPSPRPLTTSAV